MTRHSPKLVDWQPPEDGRLPAECFPVGDTIREEAEYRASAEYLAEMTSLSRDEVAGVLDGTIPARRIVLVRLAGHLGLSPQYLCDLEASYRWWLAHGTSPQAKAARQRLGDPAPEEGEGA